MVFGTSTKPNNQGKGEEEKMENKKNRKIKQVANSKMSQPMCKSEGKKVRGKRREE